MKEEPGLKLTDDIPYVFDLLWDIKSRRKLYDSIIIDLDNVASKLDSMYDLNITITTEEANALDEIMTAVINIYKLYKGE